MYNNYTKLAITCDKHEKRIADLCAENEQLKKDLKSAYMAIVLVNEGDYPWKNGSNASRVLTKAEKFFGISEENS